MPREYMSVQASVIWRWAALVGHLSLTVGASLLRSANVDVAGLVSYDYSRHGQDWVMGACASRSRQSPIDFPAGDLSMPPSARLSYLYQKVAAPLELMNNGHSYSLDLTGLGYGGITYENAWYNLLYINVHANSEHTCTGQRKPVELHMVHKRFDGDSLIIVAVPLDCLGPVAGNCAASFASPKVPPPPQYQYIAPAEADPYFNSAVQYFLRAPLPPVRSKIVVPPDLNFPMDLNSFLAGGTYFEYAGSTTTPPCAEVVTWLVRREPVWASFAQVKALHDGISGITAAQGNFRDVMPLNGRAVSVRVAVEEDPPMSSQSLQVPPPRLAAHPDPGFTSMRWAKDALRISVSASDYIQDLDRRVRNAAQAHSNALSPQYSTTLIMTTTPFMYTATMNLNPESVAKSMAATISAAAKDAVASAAQQVSQQAKTSAIEAANEAVRMVMSSAVSATLKPGTYQRIELPGYS